MVNETTGALSNSSSVNYDLSAVPQNPPTNNAITACSGPLWKDVHGSVTGVGGGPWGVKFFGTNGNAILSANANQTWLVEKWCGDQLKQDVPVRAQVQVNMQTGEAVWSLVKYPIRMQLDTASFATHYPHLAESFLEFIRPILQAQQVGGQHSEASVPTPYFTPPFVANVIRQQPIRAMQDDDKKAHILDTLGWLATVDFSRMAENPELARDVRSSLENLAGAFALSSDFDQGNVENRQRPAYFKQNRLALLGFINDYFKYSPSLDSGPLIKYWDNVLQYFSIENSITTLFQDTIASLTSGKAFGQDASDPLLELYSYALYEDKVRSPLAVVKMLDQMKDAIGNETGGDTVRIVLLNLIRAEIERWHDFPSGSLMNRIDQLLSSGNGLSGASREYIIGKMHLTALSANGGAHASIVDLLDRLTAENLTSAAAGTVMETLLTCVSPHNLTAQRKWSAVMDRCVDKTRSLSEA